MNYDNRIQKFKELFKSADAVLIGGGSGLSTASGIEYDGERFKSNFADFIEKYGLTDMYSAGFYGFDTPEEKWAYWSRHVYLNRFDKAKREIYEMLLNLVKGKEHFVITTNVDHQFRLAGFDKNNIFYMQGDYGLFQCSVPCHNQTYENKEAIEKMYKTQKNCKIDSSLVPHCPKCGSEMEMNLRKDGSFVQDQGWYKHLELYKNFIEKYKDKKLLLLEFGVGYNTPAIIKYPFEELAMYNKNTNLVRINKNHAFVSEVLTDKSICFNEDIKTFLADVTK